MVDPLPPVWVRAATALLAVTIPLALLLTNVRLLLTPAYVDLAYHMPAFPDDPFGLTREERMAHAKVDLDYLLNDAGPEFLGDLRFADGSAVYNARELRHMVDVKRLVQAALRVWLASLVLAAGLGLLLSRTQGWARVAQGLHWGSILTFGLMAVIGLGILLGFSVVFVGFHRIFFQGDSWLFLYTDTLIRLFPERFWYDAFLLLAGSTLVEAVVVFVLTRARAR